MTPLPPPEWTADRVQILVDLWAQGLTAKAVATRLGGVSRNAVLGKLFRLGLSKTGRETAAAPATRTAAPQARASSPRRLRVYGPSVYVEPAPRPPRAVIPFRDEPSGRCTVLSIGIAECRWPIGEPGALDFSFCGALAAEGPYCPAHSAIAYQPATGSAAKRTHDLARALRRYL
jgi:GcrA cell cycle regulator